MCNPVHFPDIYLGLFFRQQNKSPGSYDLYSAYAGVDPEAEGPGAAAWLPIDTAIVSARHFRESRVPGLFAPRRQEENQVWLNHVSSVLSNYRGTRL